VLAGLAGGAGRRGRPGAGPAERAVRRAAARAAHRRGPAGRTATRLTAGVLAGHLADERNRLSELSHGGVRVRANFGLSYRALDPAAATLFRRLSLHRRARLRRMAGGPLLGIGREPIGELFDQLVAQLLEVMGAGRRRRGPLPLPRPGPPLRPRTRLSTRTTTPPARGDDPFPQHLAVAGAGGPPARIRRRLRGAAPGTTPRRLPIPQLAGALLDEPIEWLAAERAGLVSAVSQAAELGLASLTLGAGDDVR